MIRTTTGDIFAQDVHTIVNPVNCVGVMGRGLALQFKRRYPAVYRAYRAHCADGNLRPGQIFFVDTHLAAPRCIAHFPTKRHWRDDSRLQDISDGLFSLAGNIMHRSIPSIALPPLGCGLGGLPWPDVQHLIHSALAHLDATVILLQPAHRSP